MGKITDSLLSDTRGRTGRIVVSNVDGVEISRMRPRKANRIATPKQQLVKARFNFASRFIQGYKTLVKSYYGKRIGLKSPFNQAMGNLLQAMPCDMNLLEFTINYDMIQFTKGNLLEPQPLNAASDDPLTITINWVNNAIDESDQNDTLIVLYAEDGKDKPQSNLVQTTVKRTAETHQVQLLPKFQGMSVHVWISFISELKQESASSVYIGKVVVS